MNRFVFPFSLLAATSALSCLGQGQSTLSFDTSNFKVTVALDRQVYLPGETAEITLTVSNLARRTVVSLTPFLWSTSCLGFARKGGPAPNFEGECAAVPVDSSNTTTFQGGETKQIVLNSFDPFSELGHSAMRGGSIVTHPGSYVLAFQYGASISEIDYTVARTILEADEVVRLRDGLQHFETLPPRPFPDYTHVLALRSDDVSYICVQQDTVSSSRRVIRTPIVRKSLDFDDSHVEINAATPFKRIATSNSAIVKLSATADAKENLTIEWTDANGGQGQVYYPASYPARDPSRDQ